jgi:hypothetical protein
MTGLLYPNEPTLVGPLEDVATELREIMHDALQTKQGFITADLAVALVKIEAVQQFLERESNESPEK